MPLGKEGIDRALWITVRDLRELLANDVFWPDDELHPNGVGNLRIERDGVIIGFIDIPFSSIELWKEDDNVDGGYTYDSIYLEGAIE